MPGKDNYHSNQKVAARFCEIEGSIKLANDSFHLRARADRIDVNQDGSVHIIDYKTGVSPSIKQAQSLSPQLALEGLIATKGGFDEGGSGEIADLTYLRLRRVKNSRPNPFQPGIKLRITLLTMQGQNFLNW